MQSDQELFKKKSSIAIGQGYIKVFNDQAAAWRVTFDSSGEEGIRFWSTF